MNRRQFIRTATVAAAATATMKFSAAQAVEIRNVHWPIGCFNRPWVGDGMTFDTALDGVKAAGYRLTGLLTATKEDPFIRSDATPEYLTALKNKIAARGLRANMGALRLKQDLGSEDAVKDVYTQIDNAKFLDLDFVLTFGVDNPQQFENYYKLMAKAAPYAQERGIKLVLKPHGGGSGAAEEIERCIKQVKQPNFKIWYDAGNIIYYTGKDPLEQLKPIAEYVTGFCAKDCDKQTTKGQTGDVWLEFGTGKVDFRAVFSELKRAGFDGPVMVECCKKGKTAEETTEGARKNRLYLEKLFASL